MSKSNVELDNKDRIILSLTYVNQEISQEDIAKKLHISQPSVAARIKKLKKRGLIEQITGVNLNKVELKVAIVRVATTNTEKILNMFRDCPFFLNGFIISGRENLVLLLIGDDLSSLESIIDSHIRPDKDVQSVDFNVIINSIKNFVIPINIPTEALNKPPCGLEHKCEECYAFKTDRCFGCPSLGKYKGTFW
jgi:Lrp/AsnC family transcriptional regulator, leucine-responsive regulatory protein